MTSESDFDYHLLVNKTKMRQKPSTEKQVSNPVHQVLSEHCGQVYSTNVDNNKYAEFLRLYLSKALAEFTKTDESVEQSPQHIS